MKPFLKGMHGRSKECGHICEVIVLGYRNKQRIVKMEKLAKVCKECKIKETINEDLINNIFGATSWKDSGYQTNQHVR